jgi:hypothetical protein
MQHSLFVFMLCHNRWGSTLRFPFHIFCLSCHAKPSKVRPANRSWGTAVGNGLGDRPPAPPSATKQQPFRPSLRPSLQTLDLSPNYTDFLFSVLPKRIMFRVTN